MKSAPVSISTFITAENSAIPPNPARHSANAAAGSERAGAPARIRCNGAS
jgi:hypothetical protein